MMSWIISGGIVVDFVDGGVSDTTEAGGCCIVDVAELF
jgi:hypothetical protein